MHELASAAKFDEGDVRAVTAALYFILTSAAKFDTSASSLSSELQQLGLPKGENPETFILDWQLVFLTTEHSTSLSKVYAEKLDDIRQALRDQSFRRKLDWDELFITHICHFSGSRLAGSGYQTKVGLCSKGLSDPNMRYAKIQMKICNDCGDQKVVNMSVTRSMLDTMIENLETIAAKMEMIKK